MSPRAGLFVDAVLIGTFGAAAIIAFVLGYWLPGLLMLAATALCSHVAHILYRSEHTSDNEMNRWQNPWRR